MRISNWSSDVCSSDLWDGQREEISQHWNPWSHVETDFSKSTAERSDRLGQILRDTHATWAACYPHSLVGLSGGLDSSIVAVCLAEASQRLECLTAVTSDPVGDERLYARLVCAQIGEIGRASWREGVCQYVACTVVAVPLKTN